MTTVSLVIGAVVAFLATVFVARPFLREPAVDAAGDRFDDLDAGTSQALALAEQRDRALAALKELEFDHRTGKLSDDDYHEQVGLLRRQAAAALRGLDARAVAAPGPPGPTAPDQPAASQAARGRDT